MGCEQIFRVCLAVGVIELWSLCLTGRSKTITIAPHVQQLRSHFGLDYQTVRNKGINSDQKMLAYSCCSLAAFNTNLIAPEEVDSMSISILVWWLPEEASNFHLFVVCQAVFKASEAIRRHPKASEGILISKVCHGTGVNHCPSVKQRAVPHQESALEPGPHQLRCLDWVLWQSSLFWHRTLLSLNYP